MTVGNVSIKRSTGDFVASNLHFCPAGIRTSSRHTWLHRSTRVGVDTVVPSYPLPPSPSETGSTARPPQLSRSRHHPSDPRRAPAARSDHRRARAPWLARTADRTRLLPGLSIRARHANVHSMLTPSQLYSAGKTPRSPSNPSPARRVRVQVRNDSPLEGAGFEPVVPPLFFYCGSG